MSIHAILHKPSNLIATVVYGELAKTEGDSFKAFPITEAVADRIHNVLNQGKMQSHSLISAITERNKKGRHTRNTHSDKFQQDKRAAIKLVMKGTSAHLAAQKYNLNVASVQRWVRYQKSSSSPI